QGGRVLQASPEGTPFEMLKGRYAEKGKAPSLDVYLKGHSGDDLRVGRINRGRDCVEQPALSVALTVQPAVIHGLAENSSWWGRGFLGRWLYPVPVSLAGRRAIAAPPVPPAVKAAYRENLLKLWNLAMRAAEGGTPTPHLLEFSAEADQAMREFESWLEPQL